MAKKKWLRRDRGDGDRAGSASGSFSTGVDRNLANNNGVIRDSGVSSTSPEPQVQVEASDPEGAVSITTNTDASQDAAEGSILQADELPNALMASALIAECFRRDKRHDVAPVLAFFEGLRDTLVIEQERAGSPAH